MSDDKESLFDDNYCTMKLELNLRYLDCTKVPLQLLSSL